MPVEVGIVIVNYKVKPLVERLLLSIKEHVRGVSYSVTVVDNASGDGIGEMIAKKFPWVRFIQNEKNVGFAAANNQVLREGGFVHALLLNPDTELIEDTPTALVQTLARYPNAGVVGCKILNPDRTTQKSVLRFPTPLSQAAIILKLHHLMPWLPSIKHYFFDVMDYQREQPVDQVMGSAFLMTQHALQKNGMLDERYFIWFEEVDYCKMVVDAGMQVVYTPTTSIIHHGGQSFAQVFALTKQKYFNASLQKYIRKHFGPLPSMLIALLRPPSLFLAWCVGILGLKRKKYA